MKVAANTIEELIEASGERAEDLRALDRLIVEVAPELKRQLFAGPSITMIGYGEMPWVNKSGGGVWPLIGVAPQKHHISVYVAADKDDVPLPRAYADRLGKVNIGKNCIRITRFDAVDQAALKALIRDAVAWSDAHASKYGRNCARPLQEQEEA